MQGLDPMTAGTSTPNERRMASALQDIAALDFEDWPSHLTCTEANTIAEAIALVDDDAAAAFLDAHHWSDDDGDQHGPLWYLLSEAYRQPIKPSAVDVVRIAADYWRKVLPPAEIDRLADEIELLGETAELSNIALALTEELDAR